MRKEGVEIYLLTPAQLEILPDGTELTSIFGETKVKGKDDIEVDTRYGLLAFGLPEEKLPRGINKSQRTLWITHLPGMDPSHLS